MARQLEESRENVLLYAYKCIEYYNNEILELEDPTFMCKAYWQAVKRLGITPEDLVGFEFPVPVT